MKGNYYLKGSISNKDLQKKSVMGELNEKEYLEKPLPIILKISANGKRYQLYASKSVSPSKWNFEKKTVNTTKYKGDGISLKTYLDTLENKVLKYVEFCQLNAIEVNQKELEKIKNELLGIKKEEYKIGFNEAFDDFLDKHRTPKGYSIDVKTKQKYNTLRKHLIAYCNHKKWKQIELSKISKDMFNSFRTYQSDILCFDDSTTTKYIKNLKTFVRYCIEKGLIKPMNLAEIKVDVKEQEIYVLPMNELIRVANAEIDNKRIDKIRDCFVFMCFTGQRFSDYQKMTWNEITMSSNNNIAKWTLITQKGGNSITVPILPIAEKILYKYRDEAKPLPLMSNQKFNESLKELAEYLGLKHQVKKIKSNNGRKTQVTTTFDKVISSHVARKSFITNSLMLNIPERVVKSITAHKDEKSFRRYVKLSEDYMENSIVENYAPDRIDKLVKILNSKEKKIIYSV